MSDNRLVVPHPSLAALDALHVPAGSARQRQLGMVRKELTAALDSGALPGSTRRSLRHLMNDATLLSYVRIAETGALRSRLVDGERPPTSAATNATRLDCLDLVRRAASLPPVPRDIALPVELRPTVGEEEVGKLRRWVGDEVERPRSPGHARFIAMLAMVLDTRARAGELVSQSIADLAADHSSVRVLRNPQHGSDAAPVSETVPLSPLGKAALFVRAALTDPLQGSAKALWVSVAHNHAGTLREDGRHTPRTPGMPLQQRGLIRSYNTGRIRYGLAHLLPTKLEQLLRGLEALHEAAT